MKEKTQQDGEEEKRHRCIVGSPPWEKKNIVPFGSPHKDTLNVKTGGTNFPGID